MLSTDVRSGGQEFSPEDRENLLDAAEASIRRGLRTRHPPDLGLTAFADALRQPRSSFVTLRIEDELRGCIGSVNAVRPLVVDVAANAFSAAFDDLRFPPVRRSELSKLTISVSVLSPMEAITLTSEEDLLEQIRPHTDGLQISCGSRKGLLLPSVWEQLPEKRAYVHALKMKAGLPRTFWSDRITVERFTTESFVRKPAARPSNHAA